MSLAPLPLEAAEPEAAEEDLVAEAAGGTTNYEEAEDKGRQPSSVQSKCMGRRDQTRGDTRTCPCTDEQSSSDHPQAGPQVEQPHCNYRSFVQSDTVGVDIRHTAVTFCRDNKERMVITDLQGDFRGTVVFLVMMRGFAVPAAQCERLRSHRPRYNLGKQRTQINIECTS